MKFDHYKKFINVALDLLLGLLAIVVVIFMLRYIIDIGSLILRPLSADLFGKVIQEVTSFFMLFEFVIMLIRYIEPYSDSLSHSHFDDGHFTAAVGLTRSWYRNLAFDIGNSRFSRRFDGLLLC